MEEETTSTASSPKGFRTRLGSIFKSKKDEQRRQSEGGRKLSKAPPIGDAIDRLSLSPSRSRKSSAPTYRSNTDSGFISQNSTDRDAAFADVIWQNEQQPFPLTLEGHRLKHRNKNIDTQLGESLDHTALLHGLAHKESFESFEARHQELLDERPPGDDVIANISGDIWEMIIDYLTPTDAANLTFSSKILLRQIGYKPWSRLDRKENIQHRINFLLPMDIYLPMQLFCFPCAQYHFRIQPGNERLRPPDILNPIFDCPNGLNPLMPQPKTRITPGRSLPFTFLQLALRAQRFGPDYGTSVETMSRRYVEGEWNHLTRYHIHKGHLLMRVVSYAYAPAALPPTAQRMLLYSREDYTPYFSACSHWRDGDLMKVCKCALDHIPKPRNTAGPKGLAVRVNDRYFGEGYNPNAIVSLCGNCQPMRRCPDCPTEYLVEIRLMEDKADRMFKRAIVVTRWSDLGDESMSTEWKAILGDKSVEYDSFATIGKRAISGIFESYYTEDHIPGQRILSLNPTKQKRGRRPSTLLEFDADAEVEMEGGILTQMLASYPTELPTVIHGYKRAGKYSI